LLLPIYLILIVSI
ncbi:hypothetical protein CI238_04499, partial [Colletotrichum incanum]